MIYLEATRRAWEIAVNEAVLCHAQKIKPAHLLMGIAKLCEGDANSGNVDEIARVRAFFADAWLDGTSFRCRLRRIVTLPGDRVPSEVMHRSVTAKVVFGRTEKLATPDEAARPVLQLRHLLQAFRTNKLHEDSGPIQRVIRCQSDTLGAHGKTKGERH